jgi:hypothetical protein
MSPRTQFVDMPTVEAVVVVVGVDVVVVVVLAGDAEVFWVVTLGVVVTVFMEG